MSGRGALAEALKALPPDIDDAIRQARRELAARMPDKRLRPRQMQQVFWFAASSLVKGKKYQQVIDLGQAIPDRMRGGDFDALMAMALFKLGRNDEARALIEKTRAVKDLPKRVETRLAAAERKYDIEYTGSTRGFLDLWGEPPEQIEELLARLGADQGLTPAENALAERLLAARAGLNDDAAAFKRDLLWSQHVLNLAKYLDASRAKYQRDVKSGVEKDPLDTKIFDLAQAFSGLVDPYDLAPLDEAKARGKSVLVMAAHAGVMNVALASALRLEMPMVMVAGRRNTGPQRPGIVHLGTVGNFQGEFLKVAKTLKKEPHLIRIAADGKMGGEFIMREVCGMPLKIGAGAFALGYYGQAAMFFTGTRWANGRLQVYLKPGPVCEPGTDRDEWDNAGADFYRDCVEEIVLGPACDLGVMSAFRGARSQQTEPGDG